MNPRGDVTVASPATAPRQVARVASRGAVKVRRLSIARIGADDVARWRDLAERAAEPNPCYEPQFLCPAAAALGPADLGLAIATHRGRWCGLLPLRRRWTVGRTPFPVMAAWSHAMSFSDTPLLAADAAAAAASAIAADVASAGSGLGLFVERVPEGAVADALVEALAPSRRGVVVSRFSRAAAFRRGGADGGRGWDARKRRRLERDHGEVEVIDSAGTRDEIQRFLDLEHGGWKGRAGTSVASSSATAEFFRRMCLGFAEANRLQVLELRAGGELVAMKVNLVTGDVLHHLKVAYDERFATYSPGRLLEGIVLRRFHGNDQFSSMDSCASASGSLLDELWPDRRAMVSVAVPSSRAARSLLAAVARRRLGEDPR